MQPALREDAAAVARAVARVRMQMTVARAWWSISIGVSLALVVAELVIIFGSTLIAASRTRWIAGIAMIGLSVIAAIVAALYRRPTARDAAAVLDQQLGLGERVITAVQFLGQDDAFAQLVERDAAASLASARIAGVPRIATPRAALATLLCALALPAAFALSSAVQQRDVMRGIGSLASRAGLEIPGAAAEGVIATAAAPADVRSQNADQAPRAGIELPRTQTAAEAAGDNGKSTSDVARRGAGDRGADSGAGQGSPAKSGAAADAGAGGVSAGDLTAGAGQSTVATASQDNSAAYRAAWSKAQAAVAIERLPSDRRPLVRKYFAAIRPQESR